LLGGLFESHGVIRLDSHGRPRSALPGHLISKGARVTIHQFAKAFAAFGVLAWLVSALIERLNRKMVLKRSRPYSRIPSVGQSELAAEAQDRERRLLQEQ